MSSIKNTKTTPIVAEYIDECASQYFTQEEKDTIEELSNVQEFKKGDIIIREGQHVKTCYHVIKGCLRQYKSVDGEERTIAFYTEDDSLLSMSTYKSSYISKFDVECMEACTLSVMTAENEREMYKRFPKIESISRMSLEQMIKENQERFADFMISNPEERYLNLIEKRPGLLTRIPQYHLASFLGIKPESLSRIRKRLAQK